MTTVEVAPGTATITPNRLRLAIAIMAYGGQICVRQAQMWLELGAAALLNVEQVALTKFMYLDMNPVDRARNAALGAAMAAGADWLLMIDADTFVMPAAGATPGDQILRMIIEAAKADAAVVIAPVRARDETKRIMAYHIEEHEKHRVEVPGTVNGAEFSRLVYKPIEPNPPPGQPDPHWPGLVVVDAGAAAVMAINLHKVGEAWFRFFQPSYGSTAAREQAGLSEDLEFCRQIRRDGGKILCDTRVVTGHMARPEVIVSDIAATAFGQSIPELKLEVTRAPTKA